jgi:hypothetical protein
MESTTSRYPKSYKNSDVKRNRKTLDFDLFERWRLEKEKEEAGVTYFLQGWAFKVILASSAYRPACCISKPTSPLFQNFILLTKPHLTTMAPSLEEPRESATSQLVAPEPEHCPGPESQQAGQGDACQTCPNKEICASAPKGPDPDIPAITERLLDVKHKILVRSLLSVCRSRTNTIAGPQRQRWRRKKHPYRSPRPCLRKQSRLSNRRPRPRPHRALDA